jgi:hypothetical protein
VAWQLTAGNPHTGTSNYLSYFSTNLKLKWGLTWKPENRRT